MKLARSYFSAGNSQKALELLDTVPDKETVPCQKLLLDCLKATEPSSERIIQVDRHVLDLRVASALDEEIGQNVHEPIVHGAKLSRLVKSV